MAVNPFAGREHSFMLQAVMEMHKTLGGLEKKIEGMDVRVEKHIDKLDARIEEVSKEVSKHGKWQFAANVVLLLTLGFVGYLGTILWDIAKVTFGIAP